MIFAGCKVRERGGLRRTGHILRIIAPGDRGQGEDRAAEVEVVWEYPATIDSCVSSDDLESLCMCALCRPRIGVM